MARLLRLEYPGAIYHVTARGNERRSIFGTERDCEVFLEKLEACVLRHGVRMYAYVLMGNHFHFLMETPRANLSAFMQQVLSSYTVYYNVKRGRVGHLFSGRYKARVVRGDEYLLKLSRYVHLNPVKVAAHKQAPAVARISALREHRWSSYPCYIGQRAAPKWMEVEPLRQLVAEGHGDKAAGYMAFVEAAVTAEDEDFGAALERSRHAIGSEEFCAWAQDEYRSLAERQGSPADVALRRVKRGVAPGKIVGTVCERCGVRAESLKRRRNLSDARLLLVVLLGRHAGLTQRGIGREVGLRDGSGITKLTRLLDQRRRNDRALDRLYGELDHQFATNH